MSLLGWDSEKHLYNFSVHLFLCQDIIEKASCWDGGATRSKQPGSQIFQWRSQLSQTAFSGGQLFQTVAEPTEKYMHVRNKHGYVKPPRQWGCFFVAAYPILSWLMQSQFIAHLLCARYCGECFTCNVSLHPCSSPFEQDLSLTAYYRWRNWGLKGLNKLSYS